MATVHLICTKTGAVWTKGTGKTDGHAILAAVREHETMAGLSQRAWREVFTAAPTSNPIFEVIIGDLDGEAHEADRLRAEGSQWGLIEVTEYRAPVEVDEDQDDEDEDEAA